MNDSQYIQAIRRRIAETSTEGLERSVSLGYTEILTELRKRHLRKLEVLNK